ncbi:MAG: flagellar export chaperone FliS [Planctomycetes bacterium]|nr:flagellar export chaperone FliS [Planctomycetota bacterium]MCB9868985.1 flagellar export chaperone FliS [Planctomycetota bacterium]MCB9887946.1 flagellar export chaperone FliS [Planctomycetota bacterium]
MSYNNAAQSYRRNAILTASPQKLVKLLYEGALQSLERSRLGMSDTATSRTEAVGLSLGKSLSIVSELRAALDMEVGGDLARDLDRLYEFTIDKITQANLSRRPEPVEHAMTVLRTLKEGWDVVLVD